MSKRLTDAELVVLKNMVLQGVTPADIGKKIGCAISTVHYYKGKFRSEDGINFPNVKGKRPGSMSYTEKNQVVPTSRSLSGVAASRIKSIEPAAGISSGMQFIVNGVTVQVAAGVKSVEIGKDIIQIIF